MEEPRNKSLIGYWASENFEGWVQECQMRCTYLAVAGRNEDAYIHLSLLESLHGPPIQVQQICSGIIRCGLALWELAFLKCLRCVTAASILICCVLHRLSIIAVHVVHVASQENYTVGPGSAYHQI
jgi:hypothetical protein